MWLAAHLFYSGNLEQLISQAILPFIEKARKEKLYRQFFFIRYWENGPHIRLRFNGNEKRLTQQLKPLLIKYFNNYFKSNPSIREEPLWIKELSEKDKWYPNNTIQFIEYKPEISRYGGEAGIVIAEKQFELSSKTVMMAIAEQDQWDYDSAMGIAIELHLAFAYSVGMKKKEMKIFFQVFANSWLPITFNNYPGMPEEEFNKNQQEVLEMFKQSFDQQKEILISFQKELLKSFREKKLIQNKLLKPWMNGNMIIAENLKALQTKKELFYETPLKLDKAYGIPTKNVLLWPILQSYIHMTNNRLGIENKDEAFLGYIICQGLKTK